MLFRPDRPQLRQAVEADRQALRGLLQSSRRVHLHTDWRAADDYLGRPPYLVAESGRTLVACLACPPDPAPAAWLRLAALGNGRPGGDIAALLDASLTALAELGAEELAVLGPESWLLDPLRARGFRSLTDVITYLKEDDNIAEPGNRDVLVRRARLEDLPALAALDANAFEPRWRHSADMLRSAYAVVASFEVAWLDGGPVGYQLSSVFGRYGHLARLTVQPAYQGQGIGTRLLADALTNLNRLGVTAVTLNTQADNLASRRLYERFGFRPTGDRVTVWQTAVGGGQ